jgi:hypothetical protein
MQVEVNYLNGMLYALVSIILGIVHPYERKINSKSRCNRYLLYEFIGGFYLFIFYKINLPQISLF